MVTIGTLARLAGTTARAVRHYHDIGLLPQPRRRANGYRDYGLHDAVRLLRIRRLADLGLSLPEVSAALAADPTGETGLQESLQALDAELARQEELLRARRREIAELLDRGGDLAVPDRVAGLLDALAAAAPEVSTGMLTRERDLLQVLEAGAPDQFADVATAYRSAVADPGAVARMTAWATRFEQLATADPADPAVAVLADELATEGSSLFPDTAEAAAGPDAADPAWQAFLSSLAPAQRRCMELAARSWSPCAR
jgi:DNA-binding transcriptional MerR regulator